MKWNDANCANKNGFICEKFKDGKAPKKPDTVLPLVFSDGNGDQCPDGYTTFGGTFDFYQFNNFFSKFYK